MFQKVTSLASGLGFCLHHFSCYVVPLEIISEENELCANVFVFGQPCDPLNSDTKATVWGCALLLVPALGKMAPCPCFQLTIISWLPVPDQSPPWGFTCSLSSFPTAPPSSTFQNPLPLPVIVLLLSDKITFVPMKRNFSFLYINVFQRHTNEKISILMPDNLY